MDFRWPLTANGVLPAGLLLVRFQLVRVDNQTERIVRFGKPVQKDLKPRSHAVWWTNAELQPAEDEPMPCRCGAVGCECHRATSAGFLDGILVGNHVEVGCAMGRDDRCCWKSREQREFDGVTYLWDLGESERCREGLQLPQSLGSECSACAPRTKGEAGRAAESKGCNPRGDPGHEFDGIVEACGEIDGYSFSLRDPSPFTAYRAVLPSSDKRADDPERRVALQLPTSVRGRKRYVRFDVESSGRPLGTLDCMVDRCTQIWMSRLIEPGILRMTVYPDETEGTEPSSDGSPRAG